jgi:hypothetical protein
MVSDDFGWLGGAIGSTADRDATVSAVASPTLNSAMATMAISTPGETRLRAQSMARSRPVWGAM